MSYNRPLRPEDRFRPGDIVRHEHVSNTRAVVIGYRGDDDVHIEWLDGPTKGMYYFAFPDLLTFDLVQDVI